VSETLVDVRTALAESRHARVELGRDGVIHVLAGPVTLHLDRERCEELTTTLARAMLVLAELLPKHEPPRLALVATHTPSRSPGDVP
jgi:hypothetical protein